jgi:hypothetical protein
VSATQKLVTASLAAGLTLITATAAGYHSPTTPQRVAFQSKGTNPFSFVLAALSPGKLESDSGSTDWGDTAQHVSLRDGQSVRMDTVVGTYSGAKGSFEARFRIEWTNAGNKYTAGAGTWRILGGTGAYKGLEGGGRSAHVWLPGGKISLRAEGLLNAR